jgi:ABC-type spermidine/putrescine transport system permease subunit II
VFLRTLKFVPQENMNRSFLIIILPAIAVGLGYIFVLHWLGYELEPFRFVMAGVAAIAAVILVQVYQRRKARKGR